MAINIHLLEILTFKIFSLKYSPQNKHLAICQESSL